MSAVQITFQIIGYLIFGIGFPATFALVSSFMRIPEMQRQALLQYAPIAGQIMKRNSSKEVGLQLALAFVAKGFKASRLPLLPQEIIVEAIETEALLFPEK